MATDLRGSTRPVEDLTELVADHDLVLLGEATHGTREFYELRAEVTRRLVRDHGFRGVAWEADWPPAARLSRWIRGEDGGAGPVGALGGFAERFPTWMWRNETIRDLAETLRNTPVGVYGLDLYSLRTSMAEVVAHLERIDPDAAARARARYACFDHLGGPDYGWASGASIRARRTSSRR
jgi:erythromycin esterase-like protein